MFYYIVNFFLLFGFPIAVHLLFAEPLLKWFVFFSSVRLFVAGILQIRNPNYTAESLFAMSGERLRGAVPIVRELGSANFAKGLLGVLAPFFASTRPGFLDAAALAVATFYVLAAVGHQFLHPEQRNSKRTFAMVTDYGIAICIAASWFYKV